MSEQTTNAAVESNTTSSTISSEDTNAYWRLGTIVLGFAFMISMAAHLGGPSSANASASPLSLPNQLAFTQQQAQQALSIGGFDTLDGEPAFVIFNESGQRIGALPMSAPADSED